MKHVNAFEFGQGTLTANQVWLVNNLISLINIVFAQFGIFFKFEDVQRSQYVDLKIKR